MSNKPPFSERMGFTQPKATQVNDLDQETRTDLFNVIESFLGELGASRNEYIRPGNDDKEEHWRNIWITIWTDFLHLRRDKIVSLQPYSGKLQEEMNKKYEDIFFGDKWYRVFDFIEFINDKFDFDKLSEIKEVLEKNNVGYRFVDGQFIPITDEVAIQAVGQAKQLPYENARNHIKKAIDLFADRENPDYANSMKESISAVESLTREITDENNFNKAIEKLEQKGIELHPQFKQAINNLYNFTSDEDGVRHAATDEPLQVNQATAQYMLVTCSAIVNFIVASMSS